MAGDAGRRLRPLTAAVAPAPFPIIDQSVPTSVLAIAEKPAGGEVADDAQSAELLAKHWRTVIETA